MNRHNRICIYAAYFLGLSGIGFTLPYLPLYLRQEGMSDGMIGMVSTLAALSGLMQFPIGVWSDRLGSRKPFLVAMLAVLTLATALLHSAHGTLWLALLVVLFAENGICRATAESLFGAEVAHLAPAQHVGAELGALRFWKPLGVICLAAVGSLLAEWYGIGSILYPLAVVQGLAVAAAWMIVEHRAPSPPAVVSTGPCSKEDRPPPLGLRDGRLWAFIVAMILFHISNAPGGVYLGLFLTTDLKAPTAVLSYAFVISMVAWMLVVRPAGRLADRWGRRPLLIAGWATMSLRLFLIAGAQTASPVLAIQVLDGLAQGLFIVTAAAWVTDRLADPRRVGEAQVLVGSALVAGSAIGPTLSGLVIGAIGYRAMFGLLGLIGVAATLLVILFIPETLHTAVRPSEDDSQAGLAAGATIPLRSGEL